MVMGYRRASARLLSRRRSGMRRAAVSSFADELSEQGLRGGAIVGLMGGEIQWAISDERGL